MIAEKLKMHTDIQTNEMRRNRWCHEKPQLVTK